MRVFRPVQVDTLLFSAQCDRTSSVNAENAGDLESDKLSMFVNTVKTLESEALWLFSKMESMAAELADSDKNSVAHEQVADVSNVSATDSKEGDEKAARDAEVDDLRVRLLAAEEANTILQDKLVHRTVCLI